MTYADHLHIKIILYNYNQKSLLCRFIQKF